MGNHDNLQGLEMPKYNFKEDFPIARNTEKEIASMLRKKYGAIILEDSNNDNRYDIRAVIQGREITIEVKEDFTCKKTGNVGLEYSCRGKFSGISVSQADYYIYKLHTRSSGIQYFLHRTSTLKQLIESKLYFREVNGGDKGSNSLNYLFKYELFIQHGSLLPLTR